MHFCFVSHAVPEIDTEEFGEEIISSDCDFEDESSIPPLPEQPEPSQSTLKQHALILWVVGFILRLQAKYNIPQSTIAHIVLFLTSFFAVLGRFSGFIAGLAHQFPRSLYCLRKMVKSDSHFTKYVVCPKCEQIYH